MPAARIDKSAETQSGQTQFLTVISRDEATARFRQHLRLAPLGKETVPLADALNRVLAEDVLADVDVPAFDRSNVDGFAVVASDTFGAMEEKPRTVRLNDEVLAPGVVPASTVTAGVATAIATGGMLPRGADAVVMVEHTELVGSGESRRVEIRRAATPGENVSYSGTDIARGETVLRAGTAPHLARDRRAGGSGPRRGRRLPAAAGRDLLHRQRDRGAGQPVAPRGRLRLERGDHRRRRRGAGWNAGAPRRHPRRRRGACRGPRPRPAIRPRRLLGRHVEGRGRSLLPGREQPPRPRRRRSRRRAQARQADLPRGHRRKAGRDPARISDLRDLHVPRVRRARDPRLRRPAAGAAADRRPPRCRCASIPSGDGPSTCWSGWCRESTGSRRIRWERAPGRSRRSAVPTASSRSISTPRSWMRAARSRCSSSDSDSSPPTS